MSAEQFLRSHGWRGRLGGWEHPLFPDTVHSLEAALLQQAMWLERELHDAKNALARLQGPDSPPA